MQQFNGLEMLKIDIANCYGLDKEGWTERLVWFEINQDKLEALIETAADPLLMAKAVWSLRRTQAGQVSGHNMFLDATASGLQIMAALSGCKKTAAHVNLINTGNREDVYLEVAKKMNTFIDNPNVYVCRDIVKKPVMTH